MKRIFQTILGALIMLMAFYTIGTLIMIIFGWTDTPFSEIAIPLVIIGVVFIAMVIGYYKKDEVSEQKTVDDKSPKLGAQIDTSKKSFDPLIDQLQHTIYQQKFENGNSDDYGDYNYHSTLYANLRFYEDGTVIGIRDSILPKMAFKTSYHYKGTWKVKENNISINLEKISDIDDTVSVYFSDEERRSMKYAGSIADDDSLIKAGTYDGVIKGNTIEFPRFTFNTLDLSKLHITASSTTCGMLYNALKSHPLVASCYEDNGFWYTNGETGPEWFTVNFLAEYSKRDALEAAIDEVLVNASEGISNKFWG